MKLLKQSKWTAATLLVIFLLSALTSACSSLVFGGNTHPSDADLESIFWRREAEFNELVSMSNFDSKVVRIAHDFTWLENNASYPRPDSELGFSKGRWEEYRRLFRTLELEDGIARAKQPEVVRLIASSEGMAIGGSSKGYVYSPEDLSPLAESLNSYSELPHNKPVYKKITGNWYLYYWQHS